MYYTTHNVMCIHTLAVALHQIIFSMSHNVYVTKRVNNFSSKCTLGAWFARTHQLHKISFATKPFGQNYHKINTFRHTQNRNVRCSRAHNLHACSRLNLYIYIYIENHIWRATLLQRMFTLWSFELAIKI